MKLHESGEDYLEAIFVLQQKRGMVGRCAERELADIRRKNDRGKASESGR